MCGIVGWIDWERDLTKERSMIENMAKSLQHRGPDAQGVWLSERAALAHRRLIVIDPESGQQPMIFTADKRKYVITFNGEIYNFHELRSELEGKGHRFNTRSDTEVLLRSYVEWGESCVERLNGIFAFGIWDDQKQSLFLARDHLGVKPLFYAQRGSSLLFGSEIKALLANPLVKPQVEVQTLVQIFASLTLHVPGETVYKDVFEVKPAHWMTFDKGGIRGARYWQLQSAPHTDDLETTISKIRSLLKDTVKRQLIADVPVATMLSGGLDSSGVTALAALEFKRQGRQLNTYSIDFKDHAKHFKPNFMHLSLDTPWALKVAEHSGTDQHTVVIDTPDLLENLMVPTLGHDRPGLGQMETSLYLLCRAMKEKATVALSGESADEVFGGYPWFHNQEAINAPTFPWMALLKKSGVRSSYDYLLPKFKTKASQEDYVARCYAEAIAEVPRLAGESPEAARLREIFYLNQTRFLPVLLDRKDRMSMAVGFEVRVPFCDHRLVQYVWNIPSEMKSTGDIEKGILRRALEDFLPHDVLYRRKSPYPASQNPTYVAGVRDLAQRVINDPDAKIHSFVDIEALKADLEAQTDGSNEPSFNMPFEQIVQIEEWLKRYKIEVV
jgi:asparagine synthase (glutamine-hydrolysing)